MKVTFEIFESVLRLTDLFSSEINIEDMRKCFSYYPRDVWLYQIFCVWNRIEGEGHLVGRAGFVGDEIGSAIIASRVVRDIMRLAFFLERKYAPYPKWFGTHFSRLRSSTELSPLINDVSICLSCVSLTLVRWCVLKVLFKSPDWERRQLALNPLLECIALLQVKSLREHCGFSEDLPTREQSFPGRPFSVIFLGEYTTAINGLITDADCLAIIGTANRIGGIDLISDNVDALCDPTLRQKLEDLYH
jgi:hypothetical protein